MRYLRHGKLLLPVRPLHGPAPHDVVWRPADSARVIHILKNPAYAGAYAYGRRPRNRCDGTWVAATLGLLPSHRGSRRFVYRRPPGVCHWEEFMTNQRQLADNLTRYETDGPAFRARAAP